MPIGRAPENDQGPSDFGGTRFSKRQRAASWKPQYWLASCGIQVYTGIPSQRDGAPWHDLEFKYEALCAAPDAVLACVEALVNAVENPILTLSKDGGLRFSCRILDYLHPSDQPSKQYIYKHNPSTQDPHHREVYLEIFGEEGYTCWDARYEMLIGNLLKPPVISADVLFPPIDVLRRALHQPTPPEECDPEPTPITETADDTRPLPLIAPTGLPGSDTILTIREGTLSPLAIKRPRPILHKPETSKPVDAEIPEKRRVQTQGIFDRDARILGVVTETGRTTDAHIETHLRNGGTICLNMANDTAAREAVEYFQERNVSSVLHWKSRMYRWEQVKTIPVDERMATPFQRGNVCEDAERCDTLEQKGGRPDEIICPKCPVYTECQQRGYLSQVPALQDAKALIVTAPGTFFNPESPYAQMWQEGLQRPNETERLCVVDRAKGSELFPIYRLSKDVLETWRVNYQGSVLADFARCLLNAIEIKGTLDSTAVRRVRAAFRAFASEKHTLVEQMCQVNVQGKVIAREVINEETGEELAHFSILFEGGASAYIPLSKTAADRLTAKGMPHFHLDDFAVNADMRIPMPMSKAIAFGILDTATVESIQRFPTVCRNPNWTFWHQLKWFFDYYTRDADAPMLWDEKYLWFWAPPVLHPSVKRLLLMAANCSEQHLRRAFSDNAIEVITPKSATWGAGNRLFQIRTGNYTLETIIDYDNTWDVLRLSETAQRFFLGIRTEIERDPNVKHVIITYPEIMPYLEDFSQKENVCLVSAFNETRGVASTLKAADVLWIVGAPYWAEGIIWHQSRILFGNDEIPISYEKKNESESDGYSDERVQNVYEQNVVNALTEIIGDARLDTGDNRKVVLITSFPLPGITDKPEVLLFDWADFEIAGSLDKLPEAIATRKQFEAERADLTADSRREEVERVLGCSSRQANRILKKFRGGRPLRVPFRDQILSQLSNGEKTTATLVTAIQGNPKAVGNELARLTETGEIVKVQRGVYALP